MKISKHAYARFKQRLNIKNLSEMTRRASLAISRGKMLLTESNQAGTICFEFDGFKYIVSGDLDILITVYAAKQESMEKVRWTREYYRIQESIDALKRGTIQD